MSSYCIYTMPITGDIILKQPLAFNINDLFIRFYTQQQVLTTLLIICPLPETDNQENENIGGLSIYEPRGKEIEEVVLQIASGFSLFTSSNVEIQYESRSIQWSDDPGLLSLDVGIYHRNYQIKNNKELTLPLFIRCVLTGCIIKKHDPSLTFYNRGASDASSHRFIEAFYNLFFFLEYLYIRGKTNKRKVVNELLKSTELVETIEKVRRKEELAQLLTLRSLEKITNSSVEEIIEMIVSTRGRLHHPNEKRQGDWNPEKQRYFSDETLFLQLVCMEIAHQRFFRLSFSPLIEKAYKKVQRCLRQGREIRVITR